MLLRLPRAVHGAGYLDLAEDRYIPLDVGLVQASQGTARTNTLKIKEDMTGTYTGRGNEMPITNLAVEGDQVSFKVTMKFNEQEFPMEFKGKLDGESLKGEFTSSRGTREVTGKKINPAP